MIPVIVALGWSIVAMNLILFIKTNKFTWLAWAIVQLFLTNLLFSLHSLV